MSGHGNAHGGHRSREEPPCCKSTYHSQDDPEGTLWSRLGRYNVVFTFALALVGIVIGVAFSRWHPENKATKEVTLQWLGLPGDIFIRTLKAITLPLVFANVTVAISDMMCVGRVSVVGWSTLWLYLGTTALATGFGFCSILSVSSLIRPLDVEPAALAGISLGCSTEGFLLTEFQNGSVVCTNASVPVQGSNIFILNDLNSTFEKSMKGPPDDISLSDTIYDGIFTKLFTNNIFRAFVDGNFAAVIVFAVAFSVAMGRMRRNVLSDDEKFGHIFVLMKELDVIFLFLLDAIISLTPIAVLSLIIKSFGSQDDSSDTFSRGAILIIAVVVAMCLHFIVVHVGIAGLVRRQNPLHFLSFLVPAQMMAFASASSAATIPLTLRCIRNSACIPEPIAKLVVPLGATINMDGAAIYFACACIWLANINSERLDAAACLLLMIVSILGSLGSAPVPHASLAVIVTAYNTVFNKSGTPAGFELLVAVDWLLDRFRTTLNVTGDAVTSSLVGHICPLDADHQGMIPASAAHDVELAEVHSLGNGHMHRGPIAPPLSM